MMIEVGMTQYVVKKSLDWSVENELGYPIHTKNFQKKYDLDDEEIDELLLYFPECSVGSVLSINITAHIIGIPLKSKEIKEYGNALLMPIESKRVLPISEGEKQFITDFKIEENYIEFNTFRELKKYGNRIIMKKQAQ